MLLADWMVSDLVCAIKSFHSPVPIPDFSHLKHLEVFQPTRFGSQGYPPALNLEVPIYTPGQEQDFIYPIIIIRKKE